MRKFSWRWFVATHLPVPLVVALRFWSGLGFRFHTFPVMLAAFFLGQFAGARLHRRSRGRGRPAA
ncbi:MAG TPA: hypothetical protein VGV38_02115 [Pyrinomonadaceae bacterium]|nr:hypothetical protein [Pyrinomonadaceae bacterium]